MFCMSSMRSVCRPAPFAVSFASSLVALVMFSAEQLHGASLYWSVPSGDWSTTSNWGGTLPTSADTAYVVNGGTANVTQIGATCGALWLGSGAGASGTVLMTAGSLSAVGNGELIGNYSGGIG
jgi:hypothetical protein